jgi:hypothetical protein
MKFHSYLKNPPKHNQKVIWFVDSVQLHIGSVYEIDNTLRISDLEGDKLFSDYLQKRMFWIDYNEFWENHLDHLNIR